jgi:protein phosphatase
MIRLTRDHSLVQALVDSGELDPAAARTSPLRNQITRAINMPGDPAPDVRIESLEPGDRLLLCTDGVTTMLEDDAIREILSHSADASEVCRSLVQAANDAGGLDNITALVIDYRRPAPVRG